MGRTIEQTLGDLFGLQRFEENPELDATIQKTLQRYPSLRSDGKARKNEMRPTIQKEHIMPGTKNHNEQIEEIRKNTQPPFQPTDYTGLKLDNRLADQIAQQPAAELLTFERVGDKTRIQAKLPEKGFDPETGEEFNIRINMNYFIRGMVRAVMNEDGSLSAEKADKLSDLRDELSDAISFQNQKKIEELSEQLLNQLDIPKDEQKDFERFFRINVKNRVLVSSVTSPIEHMCTEIQKLSMRQYMAKGNQLSAKDQQGIDVKKFNALKDDSPKDYENLCENYRLMAEMDPKEEKRILQPSDCEAFRLLGGKFVEQHNAWRQKNGMEKLDVRGQDYFFTSSSDGFPEQEPREGEDLYFDEHHLLTVPVKLDGKDVVLSLENTAPPGGKLFERPAVERTGVGLFQSERDVKAFHYSVNMGVLDNEKEIQKYNNLARDMSDRKQSASVQANTWQREIRHAKELAKYGNDQQVIDCFARHLYAQSVVESADKAHRPPYYKKIFDKSVEELKQNKSFKLMAKTYGVKGMREALSAPNPQAASIALFAPQQSKRYAVNDTIRKQLRVLGASMQTKGRSTEWRKLRDALSDPEMKDASRVFDAVEAYTKGKKSVRKTQQGRESFDLAMTALAIAAKNGDPAARQRAQNLVDRINEVRGSADPKHKNHVSLQGYESKNLEEMQRKAAEHEAQEAKRDAERLAKDAQDPTRAERNQQFLKWLDKQQNITQVDRARAEQYVTDHPGVREEARRISEKRGLDMDIPKTMQQPEKQQQNSEKQEPVKEEEPKGPGLGA